MATRSSEKGKYIELEGAINVPDCNPTHQQRAVLRFYESRNSDEADDIYSSEWYQRTVSFFEKFATENNVPEVLDSWEMVENLEFGPFFLSHPIAAYALWHMLQAFYELDHAVVCGTSNEGVKIVEGWKELPPFAYLNAKNSKKIRVKWSKSLERMKREIKCGALEGEALISRLANIFVLFQKLESACTALEKNFSENLKGMMFVDEMIQNIGKVVQQRRQIIMALLSPGDEVQAPTSDTESSSDSKMGSSSCSASPVEPHISFEEQTFPNLDQDVDSAQSADRRDTIISPLRDILVAVLKVSMSCIFIYVALTGERENWGIWVIIILFFFRHMGN